MEKILEWKWHRIQVMNLRKDQWNLSNLNNRKEVEIIECQGPVEQTKRTNICIMWDLKRKKKVELKNIQGYNGRKFSKFGERYKPTDLRDWMRGSPKKSHKKYIITKILKIKTKKKNLKRS